MEFTYDAYRQLIALLRGSGYAVRGYHDWQESEKCAILRHDIDISIPQAVHLAELEAQEGVQSTYFVLLRTDFYNPASAGSLEGLKRIQSLGHEIGLHFDEVAYKQGQVHPAEAIVKEAGILSSILETPVTVVSMHRPSRATLDADYQIPHLVNSYGKTFLHDFKYLSDSRCRWREPVEDIIREGTYDHLHILTHAFWYHAQESSLEKTMKNFICAANVDRYDQMEQNIRDLSDVLRRDEI